MTSSASSIRTIVSGGNSADRRNGELQFVSATSGQGLGKISFIHDGTSTNRGLKFKIDDNENMTILENGKVGIGITNPGGRLDLKGTDRVTHFNHLSDEHTYIRGGKNTSNVIINDGGGNVGIGVNNPSTYLVVGDDIGINYAIKGIHMKSTSTESKHYVVGQAIDRNVFLKWQHDSTANNAYASLSTYGGTNNLLLQQDGGGVLIGSHGTTFNSAFHVQNHGTQGTFISYHFFNSSTTGNTTANNLNLSISCNKSIHIVSGELLVSSDSRIKKNIEELDDNECLDVIRNLGVKKYKYRDPISRGTDQYVRGFIAQDVSSIIPNSVKLSNNYIPNIYNLGNTSLESNSNSSNIYIISSNNSIVLEKQKDITKILLYDEEDNRIETTLKEQINSNTIKIETDKQLTSNVFIYGEEVYDFNTLDKNAIYTTAVGALQEVDRQQQVDKIKITNLENELNILKNEVNNLKNICNDLSSRIN